MGRTLTCYRKKVYIYMYMIDSFRIFCLARGYQRPLITNSCT